MKLDQDRFYRVSLAQFKASRAEKTVASRHLRITRSWSGKKWESLFVVGCQSFNFGLPSSKREASWRCWMLAKAILKMQEDDS